LEGSGHRIIRGLFIIGEAVIIAVCCHPRRRTAPMGRLPCLVGAEVRVVGDAVAIPVTSPGARTATGRGAGLVRAGVIPIADAVAVPVGTASVFGQAWLIRTLVIPIVDAVAVAVGAAAVLGQARPLGAGVLRIGNAVAVHVSWHRAAIVHGQAGFIGTGVVAVPHPIPISVRATVCRRRAGFIRTGVGLIEETITIPISLAGRGAAVAFGQARFVGAGIFGVGDAVAIPVGAAVGELRPYLIRA